MNSSNFLQSNISQFIIRYNGETRQQSLKKVTKKLVSASSDFEIKHHKKKVRRLDCSEVASIEKISKKQHGHSVHTNADQKKEEKQFSRVPIEYAQQREEGNPADKVRGRVVYRGYAPKNTYFYFKTIKELNVNNIIETGRQDRDFRGEDIVFNSKFESGNLNAAVRINSRQYWLYMREDTNTHGLRQWFYFEVRVRKKCKLRFRIYKFTKRFSLYRIGMKPFVKTRDNQWRQDGEKVLYEYDSEQKCFFLQFQYQFQQYKETYFATLPPYTCTTMNNYLQSLTNEQKISVKRVGTSLSGFDIMAISIICRKPHKLHEKQQKQKEKHENVYSKSQQKGSHGHEHKEAVIVLARTHPGETVSNFALQSFISRVLQTPFLTDHYNFYIIPMINPDGVFLGNHRTGVLGQDLNRNFHSADLQFFPEVQTVENYIIGIQKRYKIAFLFDLHGHSAKKNIFAFGDEAESGSNKYLESRIIPKILSNTIGSFRYDHCVFKASKQKKNTARVYFANKNGINSVTFEQSYGLLEAGNIGIANWRSFGAALADSLVTFLNFPKENLRYAINNYLQHQMERQKNELQLKKQRKLQRQRAKTRIAAQIEINEDIAAKASVHDLLKKIKGQKSQAVQRTTGVIQVPEEDKSQSNSEDQEQQLSSGDQDLQMQNYQLQAIKKDIIRVGIQNRQSYKRQLYSMAEKKVQLGQHYVLYSQRLHHKQSSIAQRIYKFRSRQKHRQSEGLTNSLSFREKGESIQLPYIRK